MPGIRIGDLGAIIATKSVVTLDVEAYTVVGKSVKQTFAFRGIYQELLGSDRDWGHRYAVTQPSVAQIYALHGVCS